MQQEIKKTFLSGGMNKDADERLLPPGVYRHAVNIRVNSSEGNDSGAAKNLIGNTKLTNLNLTNATTISDPFPDHINQKVYWCVTSDDSDVVVEYDVANMYTSVLLQSSRPNGVLNFSKNHLITGINKIYNGDSKKDMLAFTDDYNPPRRFNIERAKAYAPDTFTEEDISVIKPAPLNAPEANLTYTDTNLENNIEEKFPLFSYRYKYLDREFSSKSPYSYPAFAPNKFELNYQSMENVGMVNAFNAVNIVFNTGSANVTDIQLLVKEPNSKTEYIIETFDKKQELWGDNQEQSFTFSNSKILVALPTDDYLKDFDNVPRLAKGQDLIGSRIVYGNYLEGYDIVDANGADIAMDYEVSLKSDSLEGQALPVNFSNGGWADNTISINLTGKTLKKGHSILFDIYVESPLVFGSYNKNFTFLLNQDHANATSLAADPEFVSFIENIVTGSFVSGYTDTPPTNGSYSSTTKFTIGTSSATEINILSPTVTYVIDNNPSPDTYETVQWSFVSDSTGIFYSEAGVNSSLKTNRSYEIGLKYKDIYARATTALTTPYNTLYIPQSFSTSKNKIQVQVNHLPPAWANSYQFIIKQNKGNYETIYATTFYVDGLFRWIKLEGANKDKIKEGDILIVKSDFSGPVGDVVKTRVIEVATKEKDFIEENVDENSDEIIEEPGLYMKIRPLGFNMNSSDSLYEFYSDFDSRHDDPNPTLNIGNFGYIDDSDAFQFYPITAGTRINIKIESWEKNKGDHFWGYEKSFVANQTYADFQTWFNAEVVDFGTFETDHLSIVQFTDSGKNLQIRSAEGGYGWGGDRRISGEITVSFGSVLIFETEPIDSDVNIFYETSETFLITNGEHQGNIENQNNVSLTPAIVELNVFNCFSMGNGAESYKIKDALNKPQLNFDTRPTTTSIEPYGAVRRYADLTYSDPYLEESSSNGLGSFNLSLGNFKDDIDKKYGSIQKIFARDTDLLVFQEDKVSKILYDKDLLMNADGSGNITSTGKVLGQQIAFTGEYGISKNPESFAVHAKRIYFADAKRGCILRLANDGLTEISKYGLSNYYKDLFKDSLYKKKVGGFDPYNNQYVFSSDGADIFIPEFNILCTDTYARTAFNGQIVLNIDYGSVVGLGGFTLSTNSQPMQYSLEYNGVVQIAGTLTTGAISFNKTLAYPTKAKLTLTSTVEDTAFQLSGDCIATDSLTVITVIINDAADAEKTIKNRYRYLKDGNVSQYKNFNTYFDADGLTTYNVATGNEGVGEIPTNGSTVFIESYKGYGNTGVFDENDRIGYLVTDTLYGQSDITTLLSNATFLTSSETVYTSGDILNAASFVLNRPNTEQYFYLIYDYVQKNEAPIAVDDTLSIQKGGTIDVIVLSNDTDPDGDTLTPIIVAQPTYGNAVVNSNGTISYTHDDSLNLEDSFTYKVTDGTLESNVATVIAFVGVSCQDGINASGTTGIYEVNIVLGTDTGYAGITYDAIGIPDRFELIYDGQVVADSKYVGALTGTPPNYTGLQGPHTLPVFEYDGVGFNATGENREISVSSGDIANGTASEPINPTGTLTFNKEFASPTVMKLIVSAPVGGTAWNISGICPVPQSQGGPVTAFNISSTSYDPMGLSNGDGACAFTLDRTKYHNGEGLIPLVNDYIYNDNLKTSFFNGYGHYWAISSGRSIKIESNGKVTDLWYCT